MPDSQSTVSLISLSALLGRNAQNQSSFGTFMLMIEHNLETGKCGSHCGVPASHICNIGVFYSNALCPFMFLYLDESHPEETSFRAVEVDKLALSKALFKVGVEKSARP